VGGGAGVSTPRPGSAAVHRRRHARPAGRGCQAAGASAAHVQAARRPLHLRQLLLQRRPFFRHHRHDTHF
jgi:hypothetical protein